MILFMFALSNIESKEKSYYNWYRFSIMLVNIKPYLFILGASSLSVNPETPNDSRSRSLDTFRKRRTLPSKAANCINSLCSPWWLLVMHTIISRTFASTDTNDCWFHNSRKKTLRNTNYVIVQAHWGCWTKNIAKCLLWYFYVAYMLTL